MDSSESGKTGIGLRRSDMINKDSVGFSTRY